MNSKTAKLISRAAVAVALVAVAKHQQAAGEPLSDEARGKVLRATIKRSRAALEARWKGTPRSRRNGFRKLLKRTVDRACSALARGMQ